MEGTDASRSRSLLRAELEWVARRAAAQAAGKLAWLGERRLGASEVEAKLSAVKLVNELLDDRRVTAPAK